MFFNFEHLLVDVLGDIHQSQKWLLRCSFCFILVPTVTLLATYVATLLQSWPRGPGRGREPPTAPYAVPYFQHLFAFLWNPGETYRSIQAKYPDSPFTLKMMGTKFHIFHKPATVNHVFSKSRAFAFEPVLASMMENGLNMPADDRPLFHLPTDASDSVKSKMKTSDSFISQNHNTWLKYLTGQPLEDIMDEYNKNFRKVLNEHLDLNSKEWMTVNLYDLMRRIIFETSVLTFFGTRILKNWKTIWEDWKIYNDATYIGVRSNAYYSLNSRAGRARERMLKAFEEWSDCELGEWTSQGCWNEFWGLKMNWEREKISREHGCSLQGRACLHASFLFVVITNTAPMASWFIWSTIRSEERLRRFRKEATSVMMPKKDNLTHQIAFDGPSLRKNQYIQGLFKEALRLGSANAAARVVMEDAELEGYVVKKGSVILMPVQLIHFDGTVFQDPEKFKPERWIVEARGGKAEAEQQRRQNASLRTFGGGTGLCSGRFVAEREIITVAATILLLFDIEFDGSMESAFKLNPRNLGIMGPLDEPMVRMRPR